MERESQIFAIGGKFFDDPWEDNALQHYLLKLAGRCSPRICMLAGAVGDNPYIIEQFYREMAAHDCRPTHLNIFSPTTDDFEDYFNGMDIVYVNGGSLKNLLSVWRDWGIDTALAAAWRNGVVMSGTSAGAICWFDWCITASFLPELRPARCIGLLEGSACTHYDARPDRAPSFQRMIGDGTIPGPGYATDDHTALHFIGQDLHEVVSSRRSANAYILARTETGVSEDKLPIRYIGK